MLIGNSDMLRSICYDSAVTIAKKSISASWFLTKFAINNSYQLAKFCVSGILINSKKIPKLYSDTKSNYESKMEFYKILIKSYSKKTDTTQKNTVSPKIENFAMQIDKKRHISKLSLYFYKLF